MNKHKSYKTLKILFIIGFAIQVILFFVPYEVYGKIYYWENYGKKVESAYTYAKTMFDEDPGSAMGTALRLAMYIAFIILALTYPKRWIFLTGAIIMTLTIFLGPLLGGLPKRVNVYIIFYMISFIGMVLCLTGFYIKPVKESK